MPSIPTPTPTPTLKTLPTRRKKTKQIIAALHKEFPNTECSLIHSDAWQLLVATVLSAQCTDARVNKVTPDLFTQFPTQQHFADADITEIEETIHSTGFYRNKAKSLQGAAIKILTDHNGEVPNTMKQLIKIPGVGRKTANVVLGEIWNAPDGMVVDTHVGRITRKLGLTDQDNPVKVEKQLGECVPQADFRDFGHLLIDHGRKTCRSRVPQCDNCILYRWCVKRA